MRESPWWSIQCLSVNGRHLSQTLRHLAAPETRNTIENQIQIHFQVDTNTAQTFRHGTLRREQATQKQQTIHVPSNQKSLVFNKRFQLTTGKQIREEKKFKKKYEEEQKIRKLWPVQVMALPSCAL